ncbi:MAG: 30S ribosomal protein S12 methylthiotransferase RimO [Candidatus Omnitrophica bacterium]|jgi:MiaB-like tRNA modifying enzyme YliG, TIGR01125|nr:30S ribosomal protein S12 methylthiotransferase RimO [Candidatus Omnitrophota bacterium]
MKAALISLGCAKNSVDSEVMLGVLREHGMRITAEPAGADVVIINTCAFIREAKEESIEAIFSAVGLKKQGKVKQVIVSGCLPQRYARELPRLLPEVDGFLGPGAVDRIYAVIEAVRQGRALPLPAEKSFLNTERTPRLRLTPPHYAYIKIADGCDNRCGYCVIPQIRGGYRSRPIDSVVREARDLAAQGVKEINLISQDTTFYGTDRYGRAMLDELLRKLARIKDLPWIRILYTHPAHYTSELMKVIASEPKICKYIDMPVQHCNTAILRKMRRKTTGDQIRKRIAQVRREIPGVALRTTLIVGFPQETERIFKELAAFVREFEFDRLGVFAYSPEENTPAARMSGQVGAAVKERRRKEIMMLQQSIVERKNAACIGTTVPVLIDCVDNKGIACGRTQFDAPDVDGMVYVRGRGLHAGDMVPVRITESFMYDLKGERV